MLKQWSIRVITLFTLVLLYTFVSVSPVAATSSLASHPDFSIPPGALVSYNGTIFLIMNGEQVPFATWDAFVGLGYKAAQIKTVDLSQHTFKQTAGIFTKNVAHTWGSWLQYKNTIYYSHPQGLIGVPTWDIFLENGGFPAAIVPANKFDVAILQADSNLPPLSNWDERVWIFAPEQSAFRDADRVERITAVVNALAAYRTTMGSYPASVKDLVPTYIPSLPPVVLPPDGSCNTARNAFKYRQMGDSYELGFCLGRALAPYIAGDNIVKP